MSIYQGKNALQKVSLVYAMASQASAQPTPSKQALNDFVYDEKNPVNVFYIDTKTVNASNRLKYKSFLERALVSVERRIQTINAPSSNPATKEASLAKTNTIAVKLKTLIATAETLITKEAAVPSAQLPDDDVILISTPGTSTPVPKPAPTPASKPAPKPPTATLQPLQPLQPLAAIKPFNARPAKPVLTPVIVLSKHNNAPGQSAFPKPTQDLPLVYPKKTPATDTWNPLAAVRKPTPTPAYTPSSSTPSSSTPSSSTATAATPIPSRDLTSYQSTYKPPPRVQPLANPPPPQNNSHVATATTTGAVVPARGASSLPYEYDTNEPTSRLEPLNEEWTNRLIGLLHLPPTSKLPPYQRAAIEFLLEADGAIEADDTGLGKTQISLGAALIKVEMLNIAERLARKKNPAHVPDTRINRIFIIVPTDGILEQQCTTLVHFFGLSTQQILIMKNEAANVNIIGPAVRVVITTKDTYSRVIFKLRCRMILNQYTGSLEDGNDLTDDYLKKINKEAKAHIPTIKGKPSTSPYNKLLRLKNDRAEAWKKYRCYSPLFNERNRFCLIVDEGQDLRYEASAIPINVDGTGGNSITKLFTLAVWHLISTGQAICPIINTATPYNNNNLGYISLFYLVSKGKINTMAQILEPRVLANGQISQPALVTRCIKRKKTMPEIAIQNEAIGRYLPKVSVIHLRILPSEQEELILDHVEQDMSKALNTFLKNKGKGVKRDFSSILVRMLRYRQVVTSPVLLLLQLQKNQEFKLDNFKLTPEQEEQAMAAWKLVMDRSNAAANQVQTKKSIQAIAQDMQTKKSLQEIAHQAQVAIRTGQVPLPEEASRPKRKAQRQSGRDDDDFIVEDEDEDEYNANEDDDHTHNHKRKRAASDVLDDVEDDADADEHRDKRVRMTSTSTSSRSSSSTPSSDSAVILDEDGLGTDEAEEDVLFNIDPLFLALFESKMSTLRVDNFDICPLTAKECMLIQLLQENPGPYVVMTNFVLSCDRIKAVILHALGVRFNDDDVVDVDGFNKDDIVLYNSKVTAKQKGINKDYFTKPDDNKNKVFVVGIKSGGAGLNLQIAPTLIVFALVDYNPAVIHQAVGRLDRLSSEPDREVKIFFITYDMTIEHHTMEYYLMKKVEAAKLALGGRDADVYGGKTTFNLDNSSFKKSSAYQESNTTQLFSSLSTAIPTFAAARKEAREKARNVTALGVIVSSEEQLAVEDVLGEEQGEEPNEEDD